MAKSKIGYVEVIASAILMVVGWLAIQQFGMNADLREARTNLTSTMSRVDRIVDELPRLRHDLVEINAKAPVRLAVVTTPPRRVDSATSVAAIGVIDIHRQETTVHYLQLSNQEARTFETTMRGEITRLAPNATSIRDFVIIGDNEAFSPNAPRPSVLANVPNYVSTAASYMLYSSTDSVGLSSLRNMFFEYDTRTFHTAIKIDANWTAVVGQVASRPDIYMRYKRDSAQVKP